MTKYDEYIYELAIDNVLKKHLEEMLEQIDLTERWQYLNKNFHNLDFFVDELCPSLRLCETDEVFKKEIQMYIAKLDFLKNYGFEKIGFLFDITNRVNVSDLSYSKDLIGGTLSKRESVKTFTDGEKFDKKFKTNGWNEIYGPDDYIISIESKLDDPSYWFKVHYFFEDNGVNKVIDKRINVKNLDFDFDLLPSLDELMDYKLDYDPDKKVYDEIASLWFTKSKVKNKSL